MCFFVCVCVCGVLDGRAKTRRGVAGKVRRLREGFQIASSACTLQVTTDQDGSKIAR